MAVRSVFSIDVDDSAFQAFQAKFNVYQEALRKLPGAWGAANAGARTQSEQFADIAAALMAQNELLHRAANETQHFGRASSGVGRVWRGLAHETRSVAHDIVRSTESLLKWTGIVTALGGLLGAGGLWGIDRLAASAAAGRRSSQGMGLSFGEQRSFGVDLGRLVSPDQYLSGVNEALTDVTKRWSLYGAGLTERDIAGKSTAQVGVELLPKIKAILDQTPTAQIAQVLQARGLSQFINPEDARRLKATPADQLGEFIRRYELDRKSFELPGGMLKKWQDLSVQLDRAGQKIQIALIDGLTPLAPQLEKLSGGFADVISSFLKSPQMREWMDELSDGLSRFAAYIKTPQFGKDVQTFVSDVGQLAQVIANTIKWLVSRLPSGAAVEVGLGAAVGAKVGGMIAGPPGAVVGGALGASSVIESHRVMDQAKKGYYISPGTGIAIPVPEHASPWGALPHVWDSFKSWWSGGPTPQQKAFLHAVAGGEAKNYTELYGGGSLKGMPTDKYGFPVWSGERVFDKKTGKWVWTHAAGLYQFEPATWDREAKKLGLHDFSPHSQDIAAWGLASTVYQRRTGHSLADALAHGGNAAEIARVLKDQWTSMNSSAFVHRLNRDLAETRRGGPNRRTASRDRASSGRVAIDVRNLTGGSAVITSGSLAGAYG